MVARGCVVLLTTREEKANGSVRVTKVGLDNRTVKCSSAAPVTAQEPDFLTSYFSSTFATHDRPTRGLKKVISGFRQLQHVIERTVLIGDRTILGVDDSTGAELFRFNGPGVSGNSRGLGYGDDGNLYVGNQGDNRIHVMAPVPTPAGPFTVGQSTRIRIAAPIAKLSPYVLAASWSDVFGIRLADGRRIPLDVDSLMLLSLTVPAIFQDFMGRLNASGVADATLNVPPAPALRGVKFRIGFITVDPLAPTGIRVISAARDVQIS